MPEVMHDPRVNLSWPEVQKMLSACRDPLEKALVSLLAYTGIRISEALSIRIADINWQLRTITIKALKKRGEVYRDIAVNSSTLDLLKEYSEERRQPSPWLFPGRSPENRLSRTTAYYIVRDIAERAGFYQIGNPNISRHRAGSGTHPGHHIGPRVLRHSLALFWVERTGGDMGSMRKLQTQLGHVNPGTTLGYLEYSPGQLHATYDDVFREQPETLPDEED